MKKTLPTLAAVGAVALAAVPAFGATKTVRVADDVFKAKSVSIRKGDTVVWKWVGNNPHNVKFKGFSSRLQVNGTYKHRFTRRGTFRYVCTIHGGMTGKVVVG